jgi:hypothetical protein
MAAAAAGISPETLVRWRDADEGFAMACAGARARGASELLARIRKEAKDGDWRAAMWLLERLAPNEYGRRVLVGGMADSPIQIDGELKAGLAIRASVEATKLMHEAIAIAAGTDT